jgi:hypothetical protein
MSMHRNVDLIALDLDYTLFDECRLVSPNNLEAIARAKEAGIVVTVCTARMHPAAEFEAKKAGIDAPLVVCNGSCIYHRGKVIYSNPMTNAQIGRLCNLLDPMGASYYVSTVNEAITNDYEVCGAYYRFWHVGDTGFDALPLVTYSTAKRIVPAVGDGGLRLSVVSEDQGVLKRARAALETVEGVEVYDSWYNNVEVMAPGGKGLGIKKLCAFLGIDPQKAMAIGDSSSDISMLEAVGYPVAVGNASKALKAVARFETRACSDDGVAHAIDAIAFGR